MVVLDCIFLFFKQHGHEKDITTGFEYINEERIDQLINPGRCEMILLSSTQLQESPFTHLARFVAEKRQVSCLIDVTDPRV